MVFRFLLRLAPSIEIHALVTDMAASARNGLERALPSPSFKWLYCNWHLLVALRENVLSDLQKPPSNYSDKDWVTATYQRIMRLIPNLPKNTQEYDREGGEELRKRIESIRQTLQEHDTRSPTCKRCSLTTWGDGHPTSAPTLWGGIILALSPNPFAAGPPPT